MAAIQAGDWRMVAEQASQEMNPNKLTTLIDRLCEALDEDADAPPTTPQDPSPAVPPDSSSPVD